MSEELLTFRKPTAHIVKHGQGFQRIRKRIDEIFGWLKTVAGWRKSRFRGRDRTEYGFTLALAAYDANAMEPAKERFTMVTEIDPNNGMAHYYLALIFVNENAKDQSILHLERFLELDPENPEVALALEKAIPVIPRAEMLAELMRMKYGIAIAGTHGKSTSAGWLVHLLVTADRDPGTRASQDTPSSPTH